VQRIGPKLVQIIELRQCSYKKPEEQRLGKPRKCPTTAHP